MTREQAKMELDGDYKRLELKKAYSEGKTVLWCSRSGEWIESHDMEFAGDPHRYKVVETQKRLLNVEELPIDCYVKDGTASRFMVIGVNTRLQTLLFNSGWWSIAQLYNKGTLWADRAHLTVWNSFRVEEPPKY